MARKPKTTKKAPPPIPPSVRAKLPGAAVDHQARAAIRAIASALALMTGLPSAEQAAVDAAIAASKDLV